MSSGQDKVRHLKVALEGVQTECKAAATDVRAVEEALYADESIFVNEKEYYLKVAGVGCFYACDGDSVEYSAEPGADPEWVQLYLNGQVVVALLHQRSIINFHASSFIHDGRGIIILGETGAGKSSLTLSFVLHGSTFVADDITPVIFTGSVPYIRPLHNRVKLRLSTADQLGIDPSGLKEAERGTGKQYLNIDNAQVKDCPLHTILTIEVGDVSATEFSIPVPAERFSMLRSEVCSWEMLAGMPETEAAYLQQLVQIVEQVKIVRVVRPPEIKIVDFHTAVRDYLDRMKCER